MRFEVTIEHIETNRIVVAAASSSEAIDAALTARQMEPWNYSSTESTRVTASEVKQ